MKQKLLCFLGLHTFMWKLSEVDSIDSSIPEFAKCKYCGVRYKKLNEGQERKV